MGKKPRKGPPGLDHEPSPDELTGFRSLLPPTELEGPGVVRRVLCAPIRLVALPFRLVARLVTAPTRARAARTDSVPTD